MDIKESIEKTRQGFEKMFEADAYYNLQTRDEAHLAMIMKHITIRKGYKILDLGTGTGFLAFPFAMQYPESEFIGLDIVEQTLCENRKQAAKQNLKNLQFMNYKGEEFPFQDESFDVIVSRYALHHFPSIQETFQEISRVLKSGGLFFLSDPTPNEDDKERFIDAYMQMKKDGHIKFYTDEEWATLGKAVGLYHVKGFHSSIRFPRQKEQAKEFDEIIARYDPQVVSGYKIEADDKEIWITENVNNLLFKKEK